MRNKILLGIVVVLVALCSLTFAFSPVTDNHGETLGSTGGFTDAIGFNFTVITSAGNDLDIISVTRNGNCNGAWVTIFNNTGVGETPFELGSTNNNTGNEFFFNPRVRLTNGSNYAVVIGSNGAGYTRSFLGSGNYPYNLNPNIRIDYGIRNESSVVSAAGSLHNVQAITSQEVDATPAETDYLNISEGLFPLNNTQFVATSLSFNMTFNSSTNSSLIGYWDFNTNPISSLDDQCLLDREGPTFDNGTTTTPNFNSDCKYGGCLDFDGTDDYIIHNDRVVTDYPMTLSGWVKFTSTSAMGIVSQQTGTTTNKLQHIFTNGGKAEVRTLAGASSCTKQGTTNINDGNWHLVTGVFTNETHREIFVDGVSEGTNTQSCSFDAGDPHTSLSIGAFRDSTPSAYFDGEIDCVQVFNSSLSSSQIVDLNNSATCDSTFNSSNIVSTWDMDVYQKEVTDSSGDNDGDIGPFFNSSGQVGGAMQFDGVDDYVQISGTNNDFDNGTVSFWFNRATNPSATEILVGGMISNRGIHLTTAGYIGTYSNAGRGTNVDIADGTWHHVVVRQRDEANHEIFIDGINQTLITDTAWMTNTDVVIGRDDGGTNYYGGLIDEVSVWGTTLNQSQIDDLYNSGAGRKFEETRDNVETTKVNCTLFFDDVKNTTQVYGAGHEVQVNQTLTFGLTEESTHNYTYKCDDGTFRKNTTANTFHVDNVVPVITPDTSFVNGSVYFQDLLTGQFNFTDGLMIFSYNISVDGTQIDSQDDLNTTSLVYNLSYDTDVLEVGTHNLTVRLADGHTAQELGGDYGVSDGWFETYLRYDFYDGGYVRIENAEYDFWDVFTTKREKDRYTFNFEPGDDKKDKYEFNIESDLPIHIVNKEGSKYGDNWLVIGDHWLDFVMYEESNEKVKYKRISENLVRVEVKGVKNKELMKFSSIGDLNIVFQDYTFVVANATVTYTDPVVQFQEQTISFAVNKTADINTSATLTWNGTLQTVTNTSTDTLDTYTSTFLTPDISNETANVTFTWAYTFTSGGESESGSVENNQTVNRIGIDNCSTFTTTGVNMTVKNETSNTAITDNTSKIDGFFEVWISDSNNFSEFNLSWNADPGSSYGICIDPATANFTINSQLKYGANGFEDKLYFFNNYNLDNVTDNLDLFLTQGTTQVKLIVKDFDDEVVPGAVIKVLSYTVETNSYKTTEIVETDTNGEAFAQMVLNTAWYAFIVEVDGVVKLQTLPTKILVTSKTLRIDLEDVQYFDRFDTTRGMTHALTYTNATSTFSFTYSDSSGGIQEGCLMVSRRAVNSESLLGDDCETSTAATLLHNITQGITDESFVATSYAKFADGEVYILDTLTVGFNKAYKKFGLTGIFVTFLITLTLIMIGIWHPVVSVILMIIGIIVSTVLGIYNVSWGIVIGLVIMGGILLYRLSRN